MHYLLNRQTTIKQLLWASTYSKTLEPLLIPIQDHSIPTMPSHPCLASTLFVTTKWELAGLCILCMHFVLACFYRNIVGLYKILKHSYPLFYFHRYIVLSFYNAADLVHSVQQHTIEEDRYSHMPS